jgi:hypothetical protein
VPDQTINASLLYTKLKWLKDVRIFENMTNWGHIIYTTETDIGQNSKTLHIKEWWIV